ncbi:tRNA1(Val) (adenine(37)-N6)-methyltransferase [Vibrio marisflavi CECT 7928]|uniref:tRNA1(Val) (adenine(37)-N6)-methyltransferase n=2 Tax=Vibrio marisflavi TaxID=1216040 RepID=A0ABM9A2H0_9VIBR|nr:tRNA1(Val) (adenine(37)-N6)-methyltransferase [Vibrio marisflavi CECT 7928]
MPVSTDGVLLGAWVNLLDSSNLIDIGTGTGLLSLMCAQRNEDIQILALDIEATAIQSARSNIENSSWKKQIQVQHGDILQFLPERTFDTIVCNPPYFNSGETAQDVSRAIARHTSSLGHLALIRHCKKILSSHGKANFILPIDEGRQFILLAEQEQWHVSRLCEVRPTEKKPVHRLLIELSLEPTRCEKSKLTIRNGNEYSQAFIDLTKEFYLKM